MLRAGSACNRGVPNVAISADLSVVLDKAYEEMTLAEVLAAPVSALAGVSDGDADLLKAAFNVETVGDLGRNRYFRAAHALAVLAECGAQ